MFVLRSTLDSTLQVYNADILRLRQELSEERARTRELTTQLAKAVAATEDERATLAEVARNLHTALGQGVEVAKAALDKELAAMRQELAVERGKRELMAVQLRIAQHNADWLRGLINTTNAERATLLAHRGVAIPAPAITSLPGMAPPPDDRPGMAKASDVGSGLPGNLQELFDEFSGSMEDMGDDAAAAAGIQHDETGAIHFGPITEK